MMGGNWFLLLLEFAITLRREIVISPGVIYRKVYNLR